MRRFKREDATPYLVPGSIMDRAALLCLPAVFKSSGFGLFILAAGILTRASQLSAVLPSKNRRR